MSQSTRSVKVCCACREAKPLADFHRYRGGSQAKCKPCCAAYQRAYNESHAAERAARRLAQAEANRERDRASKRAWQEANPEKRAEIALRRRARRRESVVGPVDLDALWTGRCGICEQRLDRTLAHPDMQSKSIDHIVPLAAGGGHTQDNLQWTHLICNLRKGTRVA